METPPAEELLKKIKELEASHAHLQQEMSKLMVTGRVNRPNYKPDQRRSHSVSPQRRRLLVPSSMPNSRKLMMGTAGGLDGYLHSSSPLQRESKRDDVPDPGPGPGPGMGSGSGFVGFDEKQCLNVLQCMGQAVYIYDVYRKLIYWNRAAENLYGYSAAETLGKDVLTLIDAEDFSAAIDIIHRVQQGENWTGQFPVKHKNGRKFLVIATITPFHDDDDALVGLICVSNDAKLFEEIKVSTSEAREFEAGKRFIRSRSAVATKLGLDPEQPLQVAIASKLTNLATNVSNKVRSKMKGGETSLVQEDGNGDSRQSDHGYSDAVLSDHKDDGNSSGASTPRGDHVGPAFGVFTPAVTAKSTVKPHRESSDESDGKNAFQKISSKAEAWIGKKAMQWSWKGTEQLSPDEVVPGEFYRSPALETSGSWPSIINSTSSASSCGSASSSAVCKLEAETDCLDYEILWEDLTIGDQVGQGSCATVYHGLWYGSDVAIKIFSKQEYSEDLILSFRQEVSLMKRLRHPNILLFMGAVTSPQRLCIVTEFLPRGSLFRLLQKNASKLDWRRRIHMALDIARGMNYLHNCSPPIIHRDLKSSNLLVDKNWSVKVADFGLSRVKLETYLSTRTGKGTPQWMAPEVLRNEPSDEKSDVYSFGVILWELATQKIPWEHLNAMQVIGAVGFMNQRLDIPSDVDPRWASIIESCWYREPEKRPSFQELLDKLKDLQRQHIIQVQANRAAASDGAEHTTQKQA